MKQKLSRRDFLKVTGVTSASLLLSACGVTASELPTITSYPSTNTPLPTETPALVPTQTPIPTETPIPFDEMTDEQKLAMAPENENGYKADHTFKTSYIVYKDAEGKVQELYDLSTKEWKLPKEAEYVTIEEWKDEIFSGPYVGDDGKTYPDLGIVFTSEFSNGTLTDSTKIAELPVGTAIVVLNPTGEITIWAEPQEAAKMVKDGGMVILTKYNFPDLVAKFALSAAKKEYKQGNTNIYLQFNESTLVGFGKGIFFDLNNSKSSILLEYTADGRISSPIVRMPKHYVLYKGDLKNPVPCPPLDILENNEYWIDKIIKAGYTAISFRQSG